MYYLKYMPRGFDNESGIIAFDSLAHIKGFKVWMDEDEVAYRVSREAARKLVRKNYYKGANTEDFRCTYNVVPSTMEDSEVEWRRKAWRNSLYDLTEERVPNKWLYTSSQIVVLD